MHILTFHKAEHNNVLIHRQPEQGWASPADMARH